jgi:hypothetical protein
MNALLIIVCTSVAMYLTLVAAILTVAFGNWLLILPVLVGGNIVAVRLYFRNGNREHPSQPVSEERRQKAADWLVEKWQKQEVEKRRESK